MRIAPNWRGFVHAFYLCNLPIGLQRPFWGLCLCPGKLRFPTAKMIVAVKQPDGNARGFVGWKAELAPTNGEPKLWRVYPVMMVAAWNSHSSAMNLLFFQQPCTGLDQADYRLLSLSDRFGRHC
jgi:hypothetical protein